MKIFKKTVLSALTVALLIIGLFGCRKFVELGPPTSLIATASVFTTNQTATSAMTNIYYRMSNGFESYTNSQILGLSADEFTNYSTNLLNIQYYTNNQTAVSTPGNWSRPYNYIYQANAVISGLQEYTGVSASVKQQLTGEAKFIRAFWLFYLTNLFGDVPVPLTTDYNVTDKLYRTPRVQVLQQVVNDLMEAQGLLNVNYVDISDTLTTAEKVRPNKSVATALLARAYLYLGDYNNHDLSSYQNAELQATSVINNTALYALSPFTGTNGVFIKNSKEAIWQLQTLLPSSQYATRDGQSFVLISAPNASSGVAIRPQLMASFEANDLRKANWIGTYTTTSTPTISYNFPYKYKDRNSTAASVSQEYVMVLRLAEQYLIRAEAETQEGKTAPAIADLNVIRTRAGLPNYAGATDKVSLLAAILHERQVEFFAEWGQRWNDLNRTGNANSVLGSPGNVCQSKGGVWNPNRQLFPIPQADLTVDPNLTQNPGY